MTAQLVTQTLRVANPNKVYLRVEGKALDIVRCLFPWRILEENGEYLVGDFGRLNPDGTFPATAQRFLKRLEERKNQIFGTPPFWIIKTESGWVIWAATVGVANGLKYVQDCLGVNDPKALDLRTAARVANIARQYLRKQERAVAASTR